MSYRKLIAFTLFAVVLLGTAPTYAGSGYAADFSFELGDESVHFSLSKGVPSYIGNSADGYKKRPIMHGLEAAIFNGLVQDKRTRSIFLLTSSSKGSKVAIFNGVWYHALVWSEEYRIDGTKPVLYPNGQTMIYSLRPKDNSNKFAGLLIYKKGDWQYHNRYISDAKKEEDGLKLRQGAVGLRVFDNVVQIKHPTSSKKFVYTYFHMNDKRYYFGKKNDFYLKKAKPRKSVRLEHHGRMGGMKTYRLDPKIYSLRIYDRTFTIDTESDRFMKQKSFMAYITNGTSGVIFTIRPAQRIPFNAKKINPSSWPFIMGAPVTRGIMYMGGPMFIQEVVQKKEKKKEKKKKGKRK